MKVNVTYIDHSGFLLEWDNCYWLFDYSKGQIPNLNSNKLLVIFVSHSHDDHFNTEIFDIFKRHPKTLYVISSDIKINDRTAKKYGITDEIYRHITVAKPDNEYELFDENNNFIHINTLKSTDSGVAYVIRYKGKTIYHAGDLNLWVWLGEDKQYNNNMRAAFHKEISKLKNSRIDIAFAPLDPRQEDWYRLGMDALLNTVDVKYVFPMHFWDKYETIQRYKNEVDDKYSCKIMDIRHKGQNWSLT